MIVTSLFTFISNNLPTILDAGLKIIGSILEGIASDPDALSTTITDTIDKIVTVLTDENNLPKILGAGIDILLAIIKGIIDSLPTLAEKVPQIVTQIAKTLKEKWPDIKQAGIDAATVLWNGFSQSFGHFSWDVIGNIKNNLGVLIRDLGGTPPKGWITTKGYASGLDRVPYDGFPAILHKDETVLNAKAAQQWREEQSGSEQSRSSQSKQTTVNFRYTVNANDTSYANQQKIAGKAVKTIARELSALA